MAKQVPVTWDVTTIRANNNNWRVKSKRRKGAKLPAFRANSIGKFDSIGTRRDRGQRRVAPSEYVRD